jgi:hypothetical protein
MQDVAQFGPLVSQVGYCHLISFGWWGLARFAQIWGLDNKSESASQRVSESAGQRVWEAARARSTHDS